MLRQKDHRDLSFESCAKLHWQSPPDRQQEGLAAWHAALVGDPIQGAPDPRLTLKGVATELGRHPSLLWRLGVANHCGESYGGGRKVYRTSEVLAYLKSPTCTAIRENLMAARRNQGKASK